MIESKKLTMAKKIIEQCLEAAPYGIYEKMHQRDTFADVIHKDSEIEIDIVVSDHIFHHHYFVVSGLSKDEFEELKYYYEHLIKECFD